MRDSGIGESVEVDGEPMLVTKEVLEQFQKAQTSTLPPLKINEPVPEAMKTPLQKHWREMEESNRLGEDKMPEKINPATGYIWTDGSGYSSEEAETMMVSHMESTLQNKDEEFGALVNSAKKEAGGAYTKLSPILKNKIISISVKVNLEKRWAVDVYLKTGISIFITMQLLQSLQARVLNAKGTKVKANSTIFNNDLLAQIRGLVEGKLPEVIEEPYGVCYRITTST